MQPFPDAEVAADAEADAGLRRARVAVEANALAYRRAVQVSAPGDCWDVLVLTAANEKQADGYRHELALRGRPVGPAGAFFPAIQRTLVVPDPPGPRVGSGGATLGVYRALRRELGIGPDDLPRLRILLIHSGGMSQRLPAYSPLGKIFAPLPLLRPDGQVSTLFDHLYVTLAGLPERLGPGTLIVAGDVFLVLDHRHVSPPPPPPGDGVTALTMRVEASLGEAHGVFVVDAAGTVRRTLQKHTVAQMRRAGAVDADGRVLIDTGLLFFGAAATARLADLAAAGRSSRRAVDPAAAPLDLYEDVTGALAADATRREFVAGARMPALRRKLWSALHGIPFRAMRLEGEFLHLGTTRQFRDAMVGRSASPAAALFQQDVLAAGEWRPAGAADRRVYHSAVLGSGTLGPGAVVEHSILADGSSVGAGSVVSQVLATRRPLRLGDDLLLFQVPVRAEGKTGNASNLLHVQVLCGVTDDFKGRFIDGKCAFLNAPIEAFLARHGIRPRDLWAGVPEEARTLWTARLFVGAPQRDATDAVLFLVSPRRAAKATVERWRRSPRFSMAMLLDRADPQALIEHREVVAAHLQVSALLGSIRRDEDRPLDAFVGHYGSAGAARHAISLLEAFGARPAASPADALAQARACWAAAQLLQRPSSATPADARERIDALQAAAFAKVAEATERGMGGVGGSLLVEGSSGAARLPPTPALPHEGGGSQCPPRVRLTPGLHIEAAAPVRLDLAGGWSDTPPFCYERGGHVVNVAIDLDGAPPVRASVRTLREPLLVLESNDLARRAVITDLRELSDVDVRDPFALHKVALTLVGLLPARRSGAMDLRAHLRKLGAGLLISTECRVPKGSGLGTSSILAATLLAALRELAHPSAPRRSAIGDRHSAITDLLAQTLLLEQRLSTGGGWQDQVGGIVGGVKSTTSAPGVPQVLAIERLDLPEEALAELESRLVVCFSGQQRLARDILRRAMGRWLAREPEAVEILSRLKAGAAALRQALLRRRFAEAARHVADYWELKKRLFPGSTTPAIDVLFLEARQHCLAASLAGAGGGGFACFLCASAAQARRLRDHLARLSARPGSLGLGTLFAATINRAGLTLRRA